MDEGGKDDNDVFDIADDDESDEFAPEAGECIDEHEPAVSGPDEHPAEAHEARSKPSPVQPSNEDVAKHYRTRCP